MRLIGLLALVALLAGCGAPPADEHPAQVTLAHDGADRSYRLHVPSGIDEGAPLVLVLHGGFGSARQAEASYGWDELADREGFVVAYPEAVGRAWNAGGGCCGQAAADDVDDVGFLDAVVEDVRSRTGAGTAFATGMSNGAMMTYRAACETTTFAAVAVVAGTVVGDCPRPAPISVLHVHGEQDSTVRPDGEPGDGRAVIDGEPVADVVARFRAANACGEPMITVSGSVTTSAANCPDGARVELVTIAGAGHQWPGADDRPGTEHLLGTDPPSTAFDATVAAWDLFSERVPGRG